MSTHYVALRRLTVDGSVREPGDEVPEAAGWRNLRAYIGAGHVERQERADAPLPVPPLLVPPTLDLPAKPAAPLLKAPGAPQGRR